MKKTTLLFLLFGLGAITSCEKAVVACLETSSQSAAVGEEITLSSQCSEHALSFLWSFQGPAGASANTIQRSEDLFQFSFDTAGSYTVRLEAFRNYSWVGDTDSTFTTIVIN